MKQKTWLVYKHTNKINGKSYIGITCQAVHKRWQSGHGYDIAQLFAKAVKKYGWNNFIHEILETGLTLEQANIREQYWISYFHTYVKDPLCNGYNMTIGGDGTTGPTYAGENNPFFGRHHTEETKEKIRQKRLGQHQTEEAKQKISEALLGREVTDATRKLLSEKLTGLKRSAESKKHISEARHKVEASRTAEERAQLNKQLSEASTKKRAVKCIETDEIFESITAAAAAYGLNISSLANHLAGRTKSVKKLHFKFIN